MKTLIVGDVHGEFGRLNILINKEKPDIILQCGDFGWFPKDHGSFWIGSTGKRHIWDQYCLKNSNTKIYWCDGNHEDHEDLEIRRNGGDSKEVMSNVFYQPRRSYITLPDGKTVLFMGGAYSVDNKFRTAGRDWFPHLESISRQDVENLPDIKVDIVISHSCPRSFHTRITNMCDPYWYEMGKRDGTPDALQIVLDKYRPEQWFFGHFHLFKRSKDKGCHWTALSDIMSSKRWWIEL